MNLKNIFASFVAVILLAVGCTVDVLVGDLAEIKIDKTLISLPEKGGSTTVVLTASDSWKIDETTLPEWLEIRPASGSAGEVSVTLSAEAAETDREAEVLFVCGSKTQVMMISQPGDPALRPQFDPFEEGDYWVMVKVGESWEVAKPVTSDYGYWYTQPAVVGDDGSLSSVAATVFTFKAVDGGFTIQDPAGKYYYMTGTYNSFNLTDAPTSGHIWTVEQTADKEFTITNVSNSKWVQYSGDYSSFGIYDSPQKNSSMPYLVKAEAPAPELITVEKKEWSLEKTEGVLNIPANIISVNVSLDVTTGVDWLYYMGIKEIDGVQNLVFNYTANEGGARVAELTVTATEGSNSTSVELTVSQDGSVVEASIEEFLAAASGSPTLYRVSGVVSGLSVSEEYQNANLTISIPGSGKELYVFRMGPGEGKKIEELGIKNGDYLTVVGKRGEYNGSPQMVSGYYESHISSVSIEEFLAAPVSSDVNYMLKGKISDIEEVSSQFKNATLTITDDSGNELYVYRMKAAADKNITDYDFAVGDILYVYGKRSEYNGNPQMGSGLCVANVKNEGGSETPAGDKVVFSEKGYENAQEVTEVVVGDATLHFSQGTGSTSPKYYTTGNAVRLYGGGTLTVSSEKTIAKVIFTFDGSNKPTAENSSVDTGNYDVETAVWTGSAKSFVITNTASSGNFRFKAVEVIYE